MIRHRISQRCTCLLIVIVCAWAPAAHAFDPLAGDYSKESPHDVRVMSYNHRERFITDPGADPEYHRILIALDPDIICFQEFATNLSAATIAARLNAVLPIAGGGSWQIHLGLSGGIRTVLASRYPLTLQRIDTVPASSTRGVTIALANLPDDQYPVDVYLLGVHLKCCNESGDEASRQDSADAIANWLGDARGVARPFGNIVVLPTGTPMISLGDFNMVGGPQPLNTILTGNIQQTGSYGPDVKGDWDNTDIADLLPADPFNGSQITWKGSGGFPPSTLDHIFFTDSALVIIHSFVFNTQTMTAAARTAAGVQTGDTATANTSDHLPIVADLRLPSLAECEFHSECDDGDACNGAETCVGGTCLPAVPLNCNDNNSCTQDSCDSESGCEHVVLTGTCDDGTTCTSDDTCIDGQCVGTPMLCDDGEMCNGQETCSAGNCVNGTPPTCSDGDPCTSDSCTPGIGCVHSFNTAPCNDGDNCTVNDTCSNGSCAGAPMICADENICTDDFCWQGSCLFLENSASCDDGDACTENDSCWMGACSGFTRECDDGLYCNGVETCAAPSGCQVGAAPCGTTAWCAETTHVCTPFGDGDFDADNDVDLRDFAAFQMCFGQGGNPACANGNLTGSDAAIDSADLAAFILLLDGA